MGVGRGGRGGQGRPLYFENLCRKDCFHNFEWDKTNFTTFVPPGKNNSDAHDWK